MRAASLAGQIPNRKPAAAAAPKTLPKAVRNVRVSAWLRFSAFFGPVWWLTSSGFSPRSYV
jgi:hypothetical protein